MHSDGAWKEFSAKLGSRFTIPIHSSTIWGNLRGRRTRIVSVCRLIPHPGDWLSEMIEILKHCLHHKPLGKGPHIYRSEIGQILEMKPFLSTNLLESFVRKYFAKSRSEWMNANELFTNSKFNYRMISQIGHSYITSSSACGSRVLQQMTQICLAYPLLLGPNELSLAKKTQNNY